MMNKEIKRGREREREKILELLHLLTYKVSRLT